MKKTILMAAGAVVAAASAATSAQAVDVELYGQVNKAVMAVDDGTETATHFVDNDKSSSRIGVRGEQMLDNGLTASVLFEFQSEANSSSGSLNDDAKDGSNNVSERHSRVGLAGDFGALFLGKTSTATDGIAEIDIAGASDVMGSYLGRFGGGVAVSGTTVSGYTTNFDGISAGTDDRASGISYHSPVFNGVQARAAVVQGGTADLALRYSGKIDAFMVKAGIGYVSNNDDAAAYESTMAGSISAKHDSGLGATFAYGTAEAKATGSDDPSNMYFKVGYTFDNMEVAADFGQTDDLAGNDSELTAYGLAAQYNLGNGVSAGALYRTLEADDSTDNYDEINVFLANMKVKF